MQPTMVSKAVVMVIDSTIYPTISCDELNQHLYNVFTSSTANLEHHLGIPVLIAAGSHTIDHLSSIADGQGIKIKISHLPANPQPTPAEASAARAQRDEIKAIKSKRAKRTSLPNWLHPREAVSLGLDARDELAYVNKFLSTNYKTADGQRIGVIIHPQHEATFMKVMSIRCSKGT